MSDAIGPVHVKERPSVEMQSRIDAEVLFHRSCAQLY
jgi:ATP-dependent metalloprotease